jgi:threonine/homoserine/homoserine lactone efflux protein
MILLFLFSIIAGIILAAPFGPAGAMVADAALLHDRRRLEMTVAGAVAGSACLAFFISMAAEPAKAFLDDHERFFYFSAGAVIIILGILMAFAAYRSKKKKESSPFKGAKLGASLVGVFFITVFHPGSIAAFLFLTAFFAMRFSFFSDHRALFTAGIAMGSLMAFGPVGVLFWIVRDRAEKFVFHIRCGLAAIIGVAGAYCLSRGF